MEFKIGERIKYFFPNPKNLSKPYFVGTIADVLDGYIVIKNDDNITLRVSYANLDLLRRTDTEKENAARMNENYIG